MLSKKSQYAVRALVALAKNYEKGPTLISRLSDEQKIPKKFLEAILLELRNAGILGSKKGAGGGYYLSKRPAEIHLLQVIRLTGGPVALLPCVSLNFYENCGDCVSEEVCGIRAVFCDVRDATLDILSKTSIADLLNHESRSRIKVKRKSTTNTKIKKKIR